MFPSKIFSSCNSPYTKSNLLKNLPISQLFATFFHQMKASTRTLLNLEAAGRLCQTKVQHRPLTFCTFLYFPFAYKQGLAIESKVMLIINQSLFSQEKHSAPGKTISQLLVTMCWRRAEINSLFQGLIVTFRSASVGYKKVAHFYVCRPLSIFNIITKNQFYGC